MRDNLTTDLQAQGVKEDILRSESFGHFCELQPKLYAKYESSVRFEMLYDAIKMNPEEEFHYLIPVAPQIKDISDLVTDVRLCAYSSKEADQVHIWDDHGYPKYERQPIHKTLYGMPTARFYEIYEEVTGYSFPTEKGSHSIRLIRWKAGWAVIVSDYHRISDILITIVS